MLVPVQQHVHASELHDVLAGHAVVQPVEPVGSLTAFLASGIADTVDHAIDRECLEAQ